MNGIFQLTKKFQVISSLIHQLTTTCFYQQNMFLGHIVTTRNNDIIYFSYGAYSKEKTYSINDIRDIILYGQNRGVRIIMEIGSPGNAASGWQWGPKGGRGNLSVCMDQMPGPDSCKLKPCGMLNPANPDTFKVLGLIFKDLLKILPKGEIFHLGGAEVNYISPKNNFIYHKSDFIKCILKRSLLVQSLKILLFFFKIFEG